MQSHNDKTEYKDGLENRFFSQATTQNKIKKLPSDVIAVIGGGVSGLFAARELLSKGHAVVLIEAQERLGGRIYPFKVLTKNSESVELQLGANFMHNTGGNEPNLLISELDPQMNLNKPQESLDRLGKPVQLESGEVNIITSNPKHFKQAYGEMDAGCKLENLSQFDRSEYFGLYEGHENFFLYNGFSSLLNKLENELNNNTQCTILMGTTVKSVEYSEENKKHLIVTSNGTISCQQIVCALPIGVLQKGAVQFTPQLPNLINAVNSGSAARIVIQFDSSFIKPKYSHIALHDNETNTILRVLNVDHYRKSQTPSNCLIVTYVPLPGKEDKLTAELVFEKVKSGLKKEYQDKAQVIDAGKMIMEQNWSNDPNCMGGWSSFNNQVTNQEGVINWFSDIEEYGKQSGLYFAGEYMSKGENGTVHGAALSGLEAAQELENDLKSQNTISL